MSFSLGIRKPDAHIWLASQLHLLQFFKPAHQVNDQNDESDHQEQTNQTLGDVERKAQKPWSEL